MPAQRTHLFPKVSLLFSIIALAPLLGCTTAGPESAAATVPPSASAPEPNLDQLLIPAAGSGATTDLDALAFDGDPKLGALLRYAAMYSPEMIRQEHNIAQNDAFRFRGWRQYMPFINASYQIGYFNLLKGENDNSGSSDKLGGSYNISAQYPIFHWGAFSAEKDAALLREKRAQGTASIAWRNFSTGIRKSYYEMAVLKVDISSYEKRLAWAKKRQEKTNANYEAGKIDPSAKLAQSLEMKRMELDLERKKIALQAMLGKMRSDTGLETFSLDDIPATIQEPQVDVSKLEHQIKAFELVGVSESAEVKLAQMYRDELDDEVTRAQARILPSFNLGASVSQSPYQTNKGTFDLQTIFFAGITGSWNLFDRDITNTTIRSLKTQQRMIDANLKSSKTQRLTNLKNQIEEIRISQEMLTLRLEYRATAQQQLDAAKQQLALGQIDQTVVNGFEESLSLVDQQILSDRATIANAYYQFQAGIEQDPASILYTPPANED